MKTVMGFVSIARFRDNTTGVVPPFGELSTYSRTYTKEIGGYLDPSSPGYYLSTFRVAENATGADVQLDAAQAAMCLGIARECVAYASSHTLPYDIDDFRVSVAGVFPFTVQDLDFGPLVTGHNIALPEYYTFRSNQGDGMEVKIWLSDAALQDQYTDFSITVIPQMDNLNNFFLPFPQALTFLNQVPVETLIDKTQAAKDLNPDSVIKMLKFKFYNRFNRAETRDVYFSYLIYGKEGNYIDALKEATVDYLVKNSEFAEDQWELILPELFERTEFLIVPRWDAIAAQNAEDSSSLYSQSLMPTDIELFTERFLSFYGAEFVKNNTYTMPSPWRFLFSTVTNGLKNSEGLKDWKTLFPDYMPVPISDSPNFGRMQAATQLFAYFIVDVLRAAETVTPVKALPVGMRRVMRDNKLFVAASHGGANYLVAAKWNQVYQ